MIVKYTNQFKKDYKIEKAFGVSMDMLLRMQAWFDAFEMREKAGEYRR